ncbi:MAG TPA: hypothetical protein VHZ54_10345 [Solirubrobacterales bacterium]|jgi:Tol biopolymer transport system component|nr:hypothetical protein [Solirubrobacterales bacterium]
MSRLSRRAIALTIVLTLAAISCGTAAAAETPPGPRLAFQRFISFPDIYFTIGPEGGEPQSLIDFRSAALPKPSSSAGFTWSADGTRFAYTGVTGEGIGSRPAERRIYVVSLAGGPAVEVPGSLGAERPVFAPDGNSLAVLRIRLLPRPGRGRRHAGEGEQSSIWLLSLTGAAPRRLTPWRHVYTQTPWSFKPDGSALGIVSSVTPASRGSDKKHRGTSAAVALRLDGGGETVIARGASGLSFSPDGTRVALLRSGKTGTDLWVAGADGADPRLISDGPRNEETPTWDPSSSRLAFVMEPAPTFHPNFGFYGNALVEVNADGTCETDLRSESSSYAIFSPSWQPGPGRGAGPIVC